MKIFLKFSLILFYLSLTVSFVQAEDPAPLTILQTANKFSFKPYQARIVSKIYRGLKTQRRQALVKIESPQHYKKEFFAPDGKLERVIYANAGTEWIYYPKKNTVRKGMAKKFQAKLIPEEKEWELLQQNYDLSLESDEPIAGRPVWTIKISPKEKIKPGRILWIDKNQYIILQSKEFRPDGTLESESTFENIFFPDHLDIDTAAFAIPPGASVSDHGFAPNFLSWDDVKKSNAKVPVLPKNLPSGFVFESVDFLNIKGKKVSHLRFTDGLSVISIFESDAPISSKTENLKSLMNDLAQYAGFSKAGKVLQWKFGNHYFILIGNLSQEALQKISQSLKS